MISGVHVIVYSKDATADRAFIQNVLGFSGVDAGNGRLIFKLPPGELGMHEAGENDRHELFLICDDLAIEVERLIDAGVECEPAVDHGWGLATRLTLPGGGTLGLYEPRHLRP